MLKRYWICMLFVISVHANQKTSDYDEELFAWSRSFAELMHYVGTTYYMPVSAREAMLNAMNAFVRFDPHSIVLDEKKYQSLIDHTNAELCGIGVFLEPRTGDAETVTIADIVPDSPAENAGIQPLDKLIAINTTLISSLSDDAIVDLLRGPEGTIVSLTTLRPKESLQQHTLTRSRLTHESSYGYEFPQQNSIYTSFSSFTQTSYDTLKAVLTKAHTSKSNGVIIDMRNNNGGLLDAAIDCLSLFMPHNSVVVTTKNKHNKTLEVLRTTKQPIPLNNLPIIILVNQQTASAAEIFAGVLAGHHEMNVFLLGTTTFGKGSVQEVVPLSNHCAVKLTTSLYYLPNNMIIQAQGIVPDFIVEQKTCSSEQKHIRSLYGAEKNLALSIKLSDKENLAAPAKTWKTKQQERLSQDTQLQAALQAVQLCKFSPPPHNKQERMRFLKEHLITDTNCVPQEIIITP